MKTPIKSWLNVPTLLCAFATTFFIGLAYGQETLYDFPGTPGDDTQLMQATDGNFYGTTYLGGSANLGMVFKMTSEGAMTALVSFASTNGSSPQGGLVESGDGIFYGTTYSGGSANLGTVFKMSPDGTLTTLVSFNAVNGGYPYAGLVPGNDGNFYGTTYSGGSANLGTVFKMTPGGTLTTLVSFSGNNGGHPVAGLVQGSDGNYYGTTYWGGNLALNGGNGYGTVFKMTPAGVLTTLVSFNAANGGHPNAGVIQGSDGNFYGTTYWGGNVALNGGSGYGTVFKMTPAGVLTTLVAFNAINGGHPNAGVIQGSDGDFYGTTYGGGDVAAGGNNGYGTAFKMSGTGILTTLVSFTVQNGAHPYAGLLQATDANFYGATSAGGSGGGGTVFRLNTALPLNLTQQPDDQSVSLGAKAMFQAIAVGDAPLAYQWCFNQAALLNATNANLTVSNTQITNAGSYTVVVTNFSGSVTSRVATLQVDPAFTKVTTGSIATDVGYAIGCAWGDYDNDGFMDLIVTMASESAPSAQKNVLFHNNQDGTFTKITATAITSEGRDWRGCAWADFDNDGNLDLFVTSNDDGRDSSQNELFRNNGNGTFTKMTPNNAGAIASLAAGGSEGCVWADYDNDGFLDMFVARYGTDWLYRNNGDGTFAAITNSLGGLASEDSYWAAWSDYNNDGLPDLFVPVKSDSPTNRLYLNLGAGSFARVTSGSIATDSAYSFGCAWGDYDNDGYPDLFVCNGSYRAYETNALYHNNGDGTFTKMPSSVVGSIASDIGAFASCAWGDYDNDGFLDLFVTTYDYLNTNPSVNFLYHNNGDGTFTRVLSGSLANDKGIALGCAWGDYDNDGFLDLFAARGANSPESDLLYHNNGNTNGWVEVKLVGTASNRSAIGAKVRVHATIGGKTFWQLREINSGDGLNEGPLLANFGLGDATNVDTLRIEWPSGLVQEFHNVGPKQILTITEPPRLLASTTNGVPQFLLKGGRFMQYDIQASPDLAAWSPVGTVTVTNMSGTAQIIDPSAPGSDHRFYRAVLH